MLNTKAGRHRFIVFKKQGYLLKHVHPINITLEVKEIYTYIFCKLIFDNIIRKQKNKFNISIHLLM